MRLKTSAILGIFLLSANSMALLAQGAAKTSSDKTPASSQKLVNIETASLETVNLEKLSLETIMADPDWMGNSPQDPRWSLDGQSVYFSQKAQGHQHNSHLKIDLQHNKTTPVEKDDLLIAASAKAKLNSNKTKGVFVYQDDIYLVDIGSQVVNPLTADKRKQSSVNFVNNTTISYLVDKQIFLYHLDTHLEKQIADFKLADDPDKKKDKDYLQQSQPRLLDYLKQKNEEADFQKLRKKSLEQQPFKTWYLGKDKEITTFALSPNAKWLVLGTAQTSRSGKADHMPEFITEDGYVNDRKVRPLVGTSKVFEETFHLVDLVNDKKTKLDLSTLPGVNDDPLKKMRKDAAKKIGYKYEEKKSPRAVYAYEWIGNNGVAWTKNSQQAAMMLFSYDNKDRWIVNFNVDKKSLSTAHWMSDEAWINDWAFNEFGWLPDNKTLYYLSEEKGYSHLFIKKGKRKSSQLTKGTFEVSNLTVSENGKNVFYKANKKHPGIYEIYSLDLEKSSSHAVTDLGGVNDYVLSPDEKSMLIKHSSLTKKPEIYLQSLIEKYNVKKITDTMSKAFTNISWQAPEILAIPSSQVKQPIYSRLYKPKDNEVSSSQQKAKRPAVMFVHGAGYLQNSHQGWSGYFREFMFHNYLTNKGYVVLDMDYRASKGYGRDWRTAIYRNMGTPELQDLKDGAKWLVDNMNVDEKRIGVYGGSYGGFMTFMALFKEPELFAAGAALRPVTDWVHYNHGYTSNILNTPQVDPEAFERSSPIEFAKGLNKPLLICHGMVDDNVFFKDSVRLVQKLIELKKTKYFETAIYPVEPHGFKQPSSWLDEYTRIDQLFDKHLL